MNHDASWPLLQVPGSADFIDVKDLPACWQREKITVEIEAKAKEVAVLKLQEELEQQEKCRTSNISQKRC
jgi:hypothetical protein